MDGFIVGLSKLMIDILNNLNLNGLNIPSSSLIIVRHSKTGRPMESLISDHNFINKLKRKDRLAKD